MDNKNITKFIQSKIISLIKKQSFDYRKDKVIYMKTSKSIIKNVFEEFNISDTPKGSYAVSLIENSKATNIKIDNKMHSVIR